MGEAHFSDGCFAQQDQLDAAAGLGGVAVAHWVVGGLLMRLVDEGCCADWSNVVCALG